MTALEIGRALIRRFEGCRLAPYKDVIGIPTIGWGFRSLADGSPVTMETPPLTQAEADAMFDARLTQLFGEVAAIVPEDALPWQTGACLSLAWNIGFPSFHRSDVVRLWNQGDMLGAAVAFGHWVYAAGRLLPSLEARRRAERDAFAGIGYAPESADDLNAIELAKVDDGKVS